MVVSPFDIEWNGEVIDEADTLETARFLRAEYQLAYKSGAVKIVGVRNRCAVQTCDVSIPGTRSLCRDCENASRDA